MMIVLVQDNLKLLLIVVYFKLIKIEKGKYFLVDNKRGTGLFIKIKNKICVDHLFKLIEILYNAKVVILIYDNKMLVVKFLNTFVSNCFFFMEILFYSTFRFHDCYHQKRI